MLTQGRLREIVDYDPDTGVFTRRSTGLATGAPGSKGYLRFFVDGASYRAHRLAWLYMHGAHPEAQIDHINGDRTDNRIANLREATNAQNQQNHARPHVGNRSGYLGVSWEKARCRWQALICVGGRQRHLGRFPTRYQAHVAYVAAKRELHPFSPHAAA